MGCGRRWAELAGSSPCLPEAGELPSASGRPRPPLGAQPLPILASAAPGTKVGPGLRGAACVPSSRWGWASGKDEAFGGCWPVHELLVPQNFRSPESHLISPHPPNISCAPLSGRVLRSSAVSWKYEGASMPRCRPWTEEARGEVLSPDLPLPTCLPCSSLATEPFSLLPSPREPPSLLPTVLSPPLQKASLGWNGLGVNPMSGSQGRGLVDTAWVRSPAWTCSVGPMAASLSANMVLLL